MSDDEARIRAALADDSPQPGELHDAAIRRAMRVTGAQLAQSAAKPSAGASRRRILPLGIAAGVALLVSGVILRSQLQAPGDTDLMRGAPVGAAAILPAENAQLAGPPAEFRWPAQGGASAYLLTLRAADGALLWQSEAVTTAAVQLPAEVQARLVPARQYLWSVTIQGQADVNELGPYAFRLR